MTITGISLPNIARPDVGIVMVGEWKVDSPERQHVAIDAAITAWEQEPWPAGLLSHTSFASTDGITVLQYNQWISEDAVRAFFENGRAAWLRRINAAIPDIERQEMIGYRLYRSVVEAGPEQSPGCVVTVVREFDSPDSERARQFVDSMFDGADEDDEAPTPGSIAAHFHISTDGSRVLNYAEWASEEAHHQFVGGAPLEVLNSREWREAPTPLGLKKFTVTRHLFSRTITRP